MKKINERKSRIHISFFVMIVFVVYAVIMLVKQSTIINRQKLEQEDFIRVKTQLESEISSLENELEHVGSDEYVEQIARERLGWVKEGEIKFVEIK